MTALQVTVRRPFCAALRLALPDLDEEGNRALYGVCASPHYHGHDYLLEVTVEGPVDPRTGLVVDFLALQGLVEEQLVRPVDHRNLNTDVPFLQGRVPTTENLLLAFRERLEPQLPRGLRLLRMRLQESRDHWVELDLSRNP